MGLRDMTRLSSTIPQQIFRYSTINHNKINPISPWFISGYSDAEGCFNVSLQKNPNGKFYVRPSFKIKVHSRDNLLLMRIKDYFGGIGNIYISTKDSTFVVRSLDDILKIISHFDNYPLITQKKSDFILFKQIIHKVYEGDHLSAKGLQEIVNLRASMNLGLSDFLNTIFPNTVPVARPLIENITIPHPEWMAGFVTGAPKHNLRLGISILGGSSKNLKTRCGLNKKLQILYKNYCSSRPYSTNIPAIKVNEHTVHSSYGVEKYLSLEVWGINLRSTVGDKFSRNELAMIKLPSYERSVIIGLILSDGWLRFVGARSKNAQLGFLQSGANGKYFWFVFWSISHYCSANPKLRVRSRFGKENISWELYTRVMPCLTELHSLFYSKEGVKVIPENIYELLTPVALAHIIMGDGQGSRHGLLLCTDSFTIPEVIKIMNVLIIRYQLNCTLRFHTPTQPRIYIREGSMPKLRIILEPYIIPSMKYKIEKKKYLLS